MNVVMWKRVSSREQAEGYSLDAQERAIRERVQKNGWTIIKPFEFAESAKRGAERKKFNEMFAWVKANAKSQKIQAIVSHKLDRICRNLRDAVRLQDLEDNHGVKLAFVENQFGPGAAGTFSFNVMASVAQYYSDNLREEVLKGMDEKVRQGWPTGLAPFGYMNLNVETEPEPVQPHPTESKTLARLFERFATGQYTFKSLADLLKSEGHIYRPSQPRFCRSSLSRILNNRFYIGELARNGQVHQGKYRLVIDRQTFEACQDVLHGRNRRREGNPEFLYSGGLFRCAHCGFAMCGEHIRRKLRSGGIREHKYYRCANNHREASHPSLRWKEENLDQALLTELESMRMPDDAAKWFKDTLDAIFEDAEQLNRQQKQNLTKRKTELTNMQDRLLNAYLAGTVEEVVYQAKSAEFKRELERVQEALEQALQLDPEAQSCAVGVFEFSQRLPELWNGSNWNQKREILECVSLNRVLDGSSLVMTKRKPFDFLSEKGFLKIGRGGGI